MDPYHYNHDLCVSCSRCGDPNTDMYCCQHTNDKYICKVCYEEIHWLINNYTNGNKS